MKLDQFLKFTGVVQTGGEAINNDVFETLKKRIKYESSLKLLYS